MHRRRKQKYGDYGPPESTRHINMDLPCIHEGCTKGAFSRGMCRYHYNVWFRDELVAQGRWVPSRPGRPPRAIGQKRTNAQGYIIVRVPNDDPHAVKGWALEHRMVMAEMIGRPLRPNENVHHINGKRDDNRPENLELWVKMQPSGARVQDLVAYARSVLQDYGYLF